MWYSVYGISSDLPLPWKVDGQTHARVVLNASSTRLCLVCVDSSSEKHCPTAEQGHGNDLSPSTLRSTEYIALGTRRDPMPNLSTIGRSMEYTATHGS